MIGCPYQQQRDAVTHEIIGCYEACAAARKRKEWRICAGTIYDPEYSPALITNEREDYGKSQTPPELASQGRGPRQG